MIKYQCLKARVYVMVVEVLKYFMKHGGSRKLHYFDSCHVATAKSYNSPLLTGDRYIMNHSSVLGV